MARRTDAHLDAMLRHLGAAYYESLHGRAAPADVARARTAVEERLGEEPARRRTGHPAGGGRPQAADGRTHSWRWHRRVRDVMTTDVVTVDRITRYKEIAALLAEHRISAVPVLAMGRHVAGVVSEADLLELEDKHAREVRARPGRPHWPAGRHETHWGVTAGELMTSPAVTVKPDATIPGAARLMNTHHIKRLPVVDDAGKLIGIVSRRDLLTVFLRPDALIAADVRQLLEEILFTDPEHIVIHVRGGVVTLAAKPGLEADHDLIPVAIRLIWDIDGVVDVVNKLTAAAPA